MAEAAVDWSGGAAWAAWVEAARVMAELGGVALVRWERDGAGEVRTEGVVPEEGIAEAGGRAEASVREVIIARLSETGKTERQGEADSGGAWQVVAFGAGARGLALRGAGAGVAKVAAWAQASASAYGEWARWGAVEALAGEGVAVVAADGAVALATARVGRLLDVAPGRLEGRLAREVFPGVPERLEAHEVTRGVLAQPGSEIPFVIHGLSRGGAEAIGWGEEARRRALVLRLRSGAGFQSERNAQMALLSALRHDVRSPLTAVKGLVGVLLEEPEMPVEERLELLNLLSQEAGRTVCWVEDYLLILRLRFDPRPTAPTWVPVGAFIESVTTMFQAHAAMRDVVLEIGVAAGAAGLAVLADAGLLENFKNNLVGHFLRLADVGAHVRVFIDETGMLQVRGWGPGLFASHPEEPFLTLARSTAAGKRTPGVGLGLFLVKRIADAHGWPLEVEVRDGGARIGVRWRVQ